VPTSSITGRKAPVVISVCVTETTRFRTPAKESRYGPHRYAEKEEFVREPAAGKTAVVVARLPG
jgi:hypothetical protein